jgi:hypothetical protein
VNDRKRGGGGEEDMSGRILFGENKKEEGRIPKSGLRGAVGGVVSLLGRASVV